MQESGQGLQVLYQAEYRAMLATCFEIFWLWGLLSDLGFPMEDATPLYVENTNAIWIQKIQFSTRALNIFMLIAILFGMNTNAMLLVFLTFHLTLNCRYFH